jgi:hypothetical protein
MLIDAQDEKEREKQRQRDRETEKVSQFCIKNEGH